MIQKLILEPQQAFDLVPHFPSLDVEKLDRIAPHNTRRIRVHNPKTGQHDAADVLDVPAITIAPSILYPGRDYIVNGKHRAAIAALRQQRLLAMRVFTDADIKHALPHECWGDISPDEMLASFFDRAKYESFCAGYNVRSLRDLIEIQMLDVRTRAALIFANQSVIPIPDNA